MRIALALLGARRRHDVALVAGTGLSAGRLTSEQSIFLQRNTDVWALNQFFFHHHLVPDFYNLELRLLGPKQVARSCPGCAKHIPQQVSNEEMWTFFDQSRRSRYIDTVFLTREPSGDSYGKEDNVSRLLRRAAPCPKALVTYRLKHWFQDMEGCTEARLRKMKSMPADRLVVQDFCGASLTCVVDLVLKLKYAHMALIGVDLTSPLHFYTALPEYAIFSAELAGYKFEQAAVKFATVRYGGQHATGARGIHRFLDWVAREHCSHFSLVNLAADSLLARVNEINTSYIRTILPADLMRAGRWPLTARSTCRARHGAYARKGSRRDGERASGG